MANNIALLDMDGTVADYYARLMADLDRLRSPEESLSYDLSDDAVPEFYRERINLIRSQPGWWESLATLPDGMQIVQMLKSIGFEIHVLTKGPKASPNAFSEKVKWCNTHLPGLAVTLTGDKGLVYGKVLVDDWPPYAESWLNSRPRGLVIMPDRPWNQGFEHPRVVRAYPRLQGHARRGWLVNDDEVYENLKSAYCRAYGAPLVLVETPACVA